MKKFRSTLIFAIIVGLIVTYAVKEFKEIQNEEAAEASADRFVTGVTDDQITGLKISRNDGTLELKKEGDSWEILQPVKDLGDDSSINSFVIDLVDEEAKRLDSDSKTINWATYGLDKPAATIEITSADGKIIEIQVGSKQAFDGSFFVRRANEDVVYMGDSSWRTISDKMAKDLRSKKIFRRGEDVKNIAFFMKASKKPHLELDRAEGKWAFAGNSELRLENSSVFDFLKNLKELSATDFVAESKERAQLKKFGLNSPELKLRLSFQGEDKAPEEILVSAEKDGARHLVASSNTSIYKIATGAWGSLNKQQMDFRDSKYPFAFDVAKVNEIRFRGGDQNFHIKKSNEVWNFIAAQDEKSIENEGVGRFVTAVKGLTVNRYLKGDKNKMISTKDQYVDFLDKEGNEFFSLVWKKEKLKGKEAEGENLFYAKTNLSDEVLGINMFRFTDLPVGFIKDKKKKP